MQNLIKQTQRSNLLSNISKRAFSRNKAPINHNLQGFIQHYQRLGHTQAKLDPLGLRNPQADPSFSSEHWSLSQDDSLDHFELDYRFSSHYSQRFGSVKELEDYLRDTYTSHSGVEFNHVHCEEERLWLYENYESSMEQPITSNEKIKMLQLLVRTEEMEKFLQKKYATHKRYSSEGSEAITTGLNAILSEASLKSAEAENNLEYAVLGMPHRGRLATLVVLNDYPFRNLISKVKGGNDIPVEIVDRIDDIPTHIAPSNTKQFSHGGDSSKNNTITLTLVHNPSHLEAQNAISMGKSKAKIDDFGGNNKKVLNIQGHGDAAFAGQGASYESLNLCKLPKFTIGGTIHFVTNNQVGFTTNPKDARSFPHTTDIVKPFGIPILRVNAHNVEAVSRVSRFAVRYWQKYGKDIIIDMIGFRKYGHNEVDEPSFTQPKMYDKIRSMKSLPETYADQLLKEGVIKEGSYQKLVEQVNLHFEEEAKQSESFVPTISNTKDPKYKGSRSLTGKWNGMEFSQWGKDPLDTGFDRGQLVQVAKSSVEIPSSIKPHSRLERMHIANRLKGIDENKLDWATAEAMALGSLNIEGFNTRIIGQDSERGTFSQRHAVIHDANSDGDIFTTPLRDSAFMKKNARGRFSVINTNLSELATMGYEYGYSLESPKNFCAWEAQFGDFYNPAQLIVDQFLMCSEAKWLRQSGLTLLLPHGFDGAGPEHSTCHIERFLQNINSSSYDTINGSFDNLTAQNINFQVAQPTMPSNYFHILRRQMLRNFRKPLIIAAPKIGLKHPSAVSHFEQFEKGTRFEPIYQNKFGKGKETRNVILCTGKVYFDISQKLQTEEAKLKSNTEVIRVEELAPFPVKQIAEALKKLPKDTKVTWVQEEPLNQGAFQFAKLHVDRVLKLQDYAVKEMEFIGRPSIHSFAVGSSVENKKEGEKLWKDFEKAFLA